MNWQNYLVVLSCLNIKGSLVPVDLCLNFEKKVRRTGFLAYKNQFWNWFLINPVCRNWFFRLDFSKLKYRSTGRNVTNMASKLKCHHFSIKECFPKTAAIACGRTRLKIILPHHLAQMLTQEPSIHKEKQNLHWKLGRLTPSFGSILALRLKKYFF